MKLLAWNVAHQTHAKRNVQPELTAAINALEADVIVLTEYVHREPIMTELKAFGFEHCIMTQRVGRGNQVLIASRTELEQGDITAPPLDSALPSRVLHVRLPMYDLDIMGLRVPCYYKYDEFGTPADKLKRCWDWLAETAGTIVDSRFVMLGDFNSDVDKPDAKVKIGRLLNQGWKHALPAEGVSFYGNDRKNSTTSRIDHAFVGKPLEIRSAEYVSRRDPYTFAAHGSDRLSYHAPLLVDIDL